MKKYVRLYADISKTSILTNKEIAKKHGMMADILLLYKYRECKSLFYCEKEFRI